MALYLDKRCDHLYGELTDTVTGKVYYSAWQAWIDLKHCRELWETCEFCGYRKKLSKPKGLML